MTCRTAGDRVFLKIVLRIKCPKCDTVNYEGYMGFPLCHKCHEHLLKCRYCQNFDTQFFVCSHPKRVEELGPSADPDTGRACPYFSSLHLVQADSRASRAISVWAPIVVTILVAMVVVGVVRLSLLSRAAQLVPDLKVEFPTNSQLGATFAGIITIRNPSATASLPCRITLGGDFLTGFGIIKIDPSPAAFRSETGDRVYSFDIIPPSTKRYLRFHCQAKRQGVFSLNIRLVDKKSNVLARRELRLQVSA